jgi:hypothetical protein
MFLWQLPTVVKMRKCTRCKAVAYCSVECQKKHWNGEPGHSNASHKLQCRQLADDRRLRKGKSVVAEYPQGPPGCDPDALSELLSQIEPKIQRSILRRFQPHIAATARGEGSVESNDIANAYTACRTGDAAGKMDEAMSLLLSYGNSPATRSKSAETGKPEWASIPGFAILPDQQPQSGKLPTTDTIVIARITGPFYITDGSHWDERRGDPAPENVLMDFHAHSMNTFME